jgi:hypothetical protein
MTMRRYSLSDGAAPLTPLPGSFGLSRISGLLGWLIWLGQIWSGDGSRWTHAWLVLDNGDIIEGQPGGARIERLLDRYGHREIAFTDKPVRDAVNAWSTAQRESGAVITQRELLQYEDSLRARVVATGREYEHTKYGYLNYPYIGLKRIGITSEWLRRRIDSQKTLICSQLIDAAFMGVDIHLFDDGRWSGEVTPGDLDRYADNSLVHID